MNFFFENLTSEKAAKSFNILTGLWLKKCSKLKNACTENKIWRNYRKQLSNRHHITQNSNLDIFFAHPLGACTYGNIVNFCAWEIIGKLVLNSSYPKYKYFFLKTPNTNTAFQNDLTQI